MWNVTLFVQFGTTLHDHFAGFSQAELTAPVHVEL
jgi:hypothetical protein